MTILIITNRGDYTADFLILRLQEREIPYVRFNTEDFPFHTLSSLSLRGSKLRLERTAKALDLSQVESIWYRRPGEPAFPNEFDFDSRDFVVRESREFLTGLWRTMSCLWINHPDRIRLAESKIEQLTRMHGLGLRIPDTLITNDPQMASKYFTENDGKIIAKALRAGQGKLGEKDYVLYSHQISTKELELLASVKYSPLILQEKVDKGSDIRVTVVGSEIFATEIHSQDNPETQIDWRREALSLKHSVHKLPGEIEDQCLKLVQSYRLVFGTIDLIKTTSSGYVFLELNPNGQWAWIESMTGQQISYALIDALVGRNQR